MSPPRRRSARLASVSGPKPTPNAKRTASNLASLVERDESPNDSVSQSLNAIVSSPMLPPHTPGHSSPVKPGMGEMHPSKVHPTMGPPSSALRLGFTDINQSEKAKALQSTPSKTAIPSSPFTFSVSRPGGDLGLGPEAQRMMDELRGEAAKIKAELAARREQEQENEDHVNGRKIAQPKGKAGRFSAVHMAEFKKMDSIENHPSAFRAVQGRITPAAKGVKRTQSKANLDDPEILRAKAPAPTSSVKKVVASSTMDLDTPAKRARQHLDDDASTNRPISRDGSFIPRPTTAGKDSAGIPRSHSTLASLMTPTKSSLARATSSKTPTPARSFIKSPSKQAFGGLKKSATMHDLVGIQLDKEHDEAPVQGPGRFDKMKSMFGRQKSVSKKPKSAIPAPTLMSKTPAPPRLNKELPPVPLTTPGRKLVKHVVFTPDTKRAALAQNSPSPIRSCIPRSKTGSSLVHYPSLDIMMADEQSDGAVAYPDLSAHKPLAEASDAKPDAPKANPTPADAPGIFTFRSDHTIRFGSTSPSGFGSSPGQASVRRVRASIMPTIDMPGSFPLSTTSRPNKENEAPEPIFDLKSLPHGMTNKKRHRVTDDEEEAEKEANERAAKKRKGQPVPEGEALVAPRLLATGKDMSVRSPKKASTLMGGNYGTPRSAMKKKPVLSLSRLNMLARPKYRK